MTLNARSRNTARYLVLLAIAVAWVTYVVHPQRGKLTDWFSFEAASRTFIHFHHIAAYAGNPFALYANNPSLQIGPPAWLPVAAVQWLSPWHVNVGFAIVMMLLCVLALMAMEGISRRALPDMTQRNRSLVMLGAGAAVVVDWGYYVGRFHHLDDTLALTLTVFACALIQRRKAWWVVGLLLGTAVAAKPWAIILTPVLMGLPREDRAKVTLVTLAAATAWWAPFVLGSSGTIHALGAYSVSARQGSVLWLLGIHGEVQHWLRPVQFIGGATIGVLVAMRGARNAWLAAPLAALAFRVITDPYIFGYYGLGPVMFALLWDVSRPGRWTRFPLYTAITLLVEGLLLWLPIAPGLESFSGWPLTIEISKLVWGLAILAALAVETGSDAGWYSRRRTAAVL